MTARPYLRTRDLALAGHISVQPVRNYEASSLIPKAQRSPSGYRLYYPRHPLVWGHHRQPGRRCRPPASQENDPNPFCAAECLLWQPTLSEQV